MKTAYADSGIGVTSDLAKRNMIEGVEKAKGEFKNKGKNGTNQFYAIVNGSQDHVRWNRLKYKG